MPAKERRAGSAPPRAAGTTGTAPGPPPAPPPLSIKAKTAPPNPPQSGIRTKSPRTPFTTHPKKRLQGSRNRTQPTGGGCEPPSVSPPPPVPLSSLRAYGAAAYLTKQAGCSPAANELTRGHQLLPASHGPAEPPADNGTGGGSAGREGVPWGGTGMGEPCWGRREPPGSCGAAETRSNAAGACWNQTQIPAAAPSGRRLRTPRVMSCPPSPSRHLQIATLHPKIPSLYPKINHCTPKSHRCTPKSPPLPPAPHCGPHPHHPVPKSPPSHLHPEHPKTPSCTPKAPQLIPTSSPSRPQLPVAAPRSTVAL